MTLSACMEECVVIILSILCPRNHNVSWPKISSNISGRTKRNKKDLVRDIIGIYREIHMKKAKLIKQWKDYTNRCNYSIQYFENMWQCLSKHWTE